MKRLIVGGFPFVDHPVEEGARSATFEPSEKVMDYVCPRFGMCRAERPATGDRSSCDCGHLQVRWVPARPAWKQMPDGWWQRVKNVHFPDWMLDRWPIKTMTFRVFESFVEEID